MTRWFEAFTHMSYCPVFHKLKHDKYELGNHYQKRQCQQWFCRQTAQHLWAGRWYTPPRKEPRKLLCAAQMQYPRITSLTHHSDVRTRPQDAKKKNNKQTKHSCSLHPDPSQLETGLRPKAYGLISLLTPPVMFNFSCGLSDCSTC